MQKERQKIQEENLRLQEQLNDALRIQDKLKQQAALVNKYQPNVPIKHNLSPPYASPALLPTLLPPPPKSVSLSISPQMLPPTSLKVSSQFPQYNPQIPASSLNSFSPQISTQLQPHITQQASPQFLNHIGTQMDPRLDFTLSKTVSAGNVIGTTTKIEPSKAAQIALGKYVTQS